MSLYYEHLRQMTISCNCKFSPDILLMFIIIIFSPFICRCQTYSKLVNELPNTNMLTLLLGISSLGILILYDQVIKVRMGFFCALNFWTFPNKTHWITLFCMYIDVPYRVKVFKSFQDRIKEKCSFPVPIHLIVVIVGTALSHVLHFESKFGVDVVGQIPKGY